MSALDKMTADLGTTKRLADSAAVRDPIAVATEVALSGRPAGQYSIASTSKLVSWDGVRVTARGTLPAAAVDLAAVRVNVQTRKPTMRDYLPAGHTGEINDQLRAALADVDAGELTFQRGDYVLDNSDGAYTLTDFVGRLRFEPGARLRLADNAQQGLFLQGGSPKVSGLRLGYLTAPTARAGEAFVLFQTVGADLSDITIEDSAGIGVLLHTCTRPTFDKIRILKAHADGLHLNNCPDFVGGLVQALDTGDDGLAILADTAGVRGGAISTVVLRRTGARGLTIAGHSGLTIGEVNIDTTAVSGVLIGADPTYNMGPPEDITIGTLNVRNAARGVKPPGISGNEVGLEFANHGDGVLIGNVQIQDSKGHGIGGIAAQGSLTIGTGRVRNPGSGLAVNLVGFNEINLGNLTARGGAIHILTSRIVHAGRLIIRDVPEGVPNGRALNSENNQRIEVDDIVVDSAKSRTVGVYGGAQVGRVGNVSDLLGLPVLENNSQVMIERRNGLSYERRPLVSRVSAPGQGPYMSLPYAIEVVAVRVAYSGTGNGGGAYAGVAAGFGGTGTFDERNIALDDGGDGHVVASDVTPLLVPANVVFAARWTSAFGGSKPDSLDITLLYRRA